ncbi:hypothetical protein SCUCBS95973_002841 [Sporothrix curviconia]|uniref:Xylanolytic transcriptional activator regulatory domain-containing protein n=1 Tax=Sporothrix curviconia TaxID=1260050 RepID=A0ABP0BAC6_9PEZI
MPASTSRARPGPAMPAAAARSCATCPLAPCQRCSTKTLACTFTQAPDKKKRPVNHVSPPQASPPPEYLGFLDDGGLFPVHNGRTPDMIFTNSGEAVPSWHNIAATASVISPGGDLIAGALQFDLSWESYSIPQPPLAFVEAETPTPGAGRLSFSPNMYTLPTSTHRGHHESVGMGGGGGDAGPVLFGMTDNTVLDKAEPKPDTNASAEDAWAALWQIVDALQPRAAVRAARFVDPCFPMVAPHQLPRDAKDLRPMSMPMSLALLAAMCAAALPFVVHDRALYPLLVRPPSGDALYRLSWRSVLHELHAPRLSTLQACLLLQQRLPPANPTSMYLHDTAFSWSLVAMAVSVAQTLGLHRDPSGWTAVPAWKRRLRRRLWWVLWTTETWIALARGMPRHLGRAPAGDDDDGDNDNGGGVDENTDPYYLLHLVRLSTILDDIQRAYYTLRATRRTAQHLARAMAVGRPLHARLQAWSTALPDSLHFRSHSRSSRFTINSILAAEHQDGDSSSSATAAERDPPPPPPPQSLDGNASLHLSYIVTHMMLFRALLRSLDGDGIREEARPSPCPSPGPSPASTGNGTDTANEDALYRAVTRGALLCVREFVEFVEALTPTHWNAFWHGWSRASSSMAGSFIVYLLHVVTVCRPAVPRTAAKGVHARPGFADECRELLAWIRRWRWASRVSVHGAAGAKGLTNLMLLRVETFLGDLGELGEPEDQ